MANDGSVLSDLVKCFHFAATKHKNQRRKDKLETPYINHPVGVAYIITSEANVSDLEVIQGAILHDTVEDTDTSLEEIEEVFGPELRLIVEEVSDDKSLPKNIRKQQQIDKAPTTSSKAKLIKLADKLHNLRDLNNSIPIGWSEERVQEYFVWAAKVVNGLRGTNSILEAKLDDLFLERNINPQHPETAVV